MCCGSGRVVPTRVENGLVEGNAREVLYLVWLVFISRVILQFGRLLRHLLQEFAARGKELVQTAILDVAIEALLEACFGLGMLDRLESPLESNLRRFRGTRGGVGVCLHLQSLRPFRRARLELAAGELDACL